MITRGFGENQKIITQGMGFWGGVVTRLRSIIRRKSPITLGVSTKSTLTIVRRFKSWIR